MKISVAQQWEWGHIVSSNDYVSMEDISCDMDGNCYMIGNNYDSVTYQGSMIPSQALTSFLIKTNTNGNPLMLKLVGNVDFRKMKVDRFKNIFIYGISSGIGFGFANSWHNGSSFVLKYDSLGNECWVRSTGGFIQDLDLSTQGNIGVCGYYNWSTYFYNQNLLFYGDGDMFVAELDPDGALNWLYTNGGISSDKARSLAYNPDNSVIVAGQFEDTMQIPGQLISMESPFYDNFLMKINSAGNPVWLRSFPNSLAMDEIECLPNYNIIAGAYGGWANDTLTFGSIELICDPGSSKFVVVCFDSTGIPVWANIGFANDLLRLKDMQVSFNNNIWITGYSRGDELNLLEYVLPGDTSNLYYIPFLIKYRDNGHLA